MPQYSASQLIGKTFTVKKPINFYRVYDLTNVLGYKAKPVSILTPGYKFVFDSFLTKGPKYVDNYGQIRPELKDDYFLFYGKDKKYYGVKNQTGAFDIKGLKTEGALTVEEEKEKEIEENKTEWEKATDKIADLFGGVGKTVRTVIYIGVGVWAIGYLLPKIKK